MRTPILAGNWKMYKTASEAVDFVRAIRPELEALEGVESVIAPSFVALPALAELLADSPIRLAAQNLYYEEEGAYTGEVSPKMLQELVRYVIIGHSERREHFGETNQSVNKKVHAAVKHGLTPIICVGENLAQNEAEVTESVVVSQLRTALARVPAADASRVVIAYEPVWAIGTGRACNPADAQRVISEIIRATLVKLYDEETTAAIRIQYGGSVKVGNIADFMAQPNIDGALVGGASLEPSWVELTRIAAETKGVAR
jgi:triosephosphate isomerase (TIM)